MLEAASQRQPTGRNDVNGNFTFKIHNIKQKEIAVGDLSHIDNLIAMHASYRASRELERENCREHHFMLMVCTCSSLVMLEDAKDNCRMENRQRVALR